MDGGQGMLGQPGRRQLTGGTRTGPVPGRSAGPTDGRPKRRSGDGEGGQVVGLSSLSNAVRSFPTQLIQHALMGGEGGSLEDKGRRALRKP